MVHLAAASVDGGGRLETLCPSSHGPSVSNLSICFGHQGRCFIHRSLPRRWPSLSAPGCQRPWSSRAPAPFCLWICVKKQCQCQWMVLLSCWTGVIRSDLPHRYLIVGIVRPFSSRSVSSSITSWGERINGFIDARSDREDAQCDGHSGIDDRECSVALAKYQLASI